MKDLELGMIWYFIVGYSMAWYGPLVLCRSTTMKNYLLIPSKMTELRLFESFGILYDLVFHGMICYDKV